MKAHDFGNNSIGIHCPGCKHTHVVTVNGTKNSSGAGWGWNGSLESPTFTPSLLIVGYCHSFITEGRIQFLGDCAHELAGQTVELPDWDGIVMQEKFNDDDK